MKIIVNGKTYECASSITLEKLVEELNYQKMHVAVARNQEFVPHTQYSEMVIHEGDDIEFVAPMVGG